MGFLPGKSQWLRQVPWTYLLDFAETLPEKMSLESNALAALPFLAWWELCLGGVSCLRQCFENISWTLLESLLRKCKTWSSTLVAMPLLYGIGCLLKLTCDEGMHGSNNHGRRHDLVWWSFWQAGTFQGCCEHSLRYRWKEVLLGHCLTGIWAKNWHCRCESR